MRTTRALRLAAANEQQIQRGRNRVTSLALPFIMRSPSAIVLPLETGSGVLGAWPSYNNDDGDDDDGDNDGDDEDALGDRTLLNQWISQR